MGPVKECQADEARTRRKVEQQKTVVARRLLPPLGPVVWTTTKKGEVEGHCRKAARTGDMIQRCWETKRDVVMKWGSTLRSSTFKRKGGVRVVKGGKGKTEKEGGNRWKAGIG